MKIDLKALRALCDAATDGEWDTEFLTKDLNTNTYARVTCANPEKDSICQLYWMDTDRYVRNFRNHEANARFIAATDQQTVRALIDEIMNKEKTNE